MVTNWQTLEYSKQEVRRAAKKLVDNDLSLEDKIHCLTILANFRSSHNYPMQSMIGYFRKKAFAIDKKAIVVRSLNVSLPLLIN